MRFDSWRGKDNGMMDVNGLQPAHTVERSKHRLR